MLRWGKGMALLLGVIGLSSVSVAQGVYLDVPQQVTPSASVPIRLWWESPDLRFARLNLYRLTGLTFQPQRGVQGALLEWVWGKRVSRSPRTYETVVGVPLPKVGVYRLEVTAGKRRQTRTINVTRLFLVTKKSPKRLLLFAADAQTGKPISGCTVKLLDEKGKLVTQGRTDEKGLMLADWDRHQVGIFVTAPDGSIAWKDFPSETHERYTVYLYTDRPLYRPNQRVYFKGIVRQFEGGDYVPVVNQPVQVIVRNPEDTKVAQLTLTTNRFGSFAGAIDLPEKVPLGRYGIVAIIDGEEHFAGFEVAEYRKPEFEVKVTTDKPYYLVGERITVSIKATYFFGAPVAEGQVRYTVSASPLRWFPFGDELEAWYEPPESYGGSFITRKVIPLGKDGTATFTVPTVTDPKRPPRDDLRYFIRCEVTDQSNRTVSGSASCVVLRATFQIALTTDRYAYRVGERATVHIKTVDADRKPVSVNLHLALERERWDEKAQGYQRTALERRQVTTDANGSATATFRLPKEGYYRIACWGRDERGNLTSEVAWLWVAAEGDFDYAYPNLELITDKKTYRVGETARVLFNTDRKNIWALVTVEGDDLLDAFVRPITHHSSVMDLPITQRMRPNAYLRVGYVRDGNFFDAEKLIPILSPEKFLRVEITSDKPTYQPRETVRYRVVTKDADGKPVSAELSFALVDEAIFALKADDTPDIRRFFFRLRKNRVATHWEEVAIARRLWAKEKARSGRFLYAGAFQKVSEAKVRRRFEDTAFWYPFVVTDEKGEAMVEVQLPDNLTTWRATVRAVTLQTQVGSTIHRIRATKPLLIRLQLPRFFTQHDVVKILTVVHNNTDEPQSVSVGLKAKGAIVSLTRVVANPAPYRDGRMAGFIPVGIAPMPPVPEQTATIPPRSSQTFAWWVSVPEVPQGGRAVFTAAVASKSGLTDAVSLSVPVKAHGVEVVQAKAGVTETTATMTFHLPDDAIPSASYIEIRLAPSLVGPMLGSLRYLVGYPYG
jgi:uncharacterized protein YfaS (alpha-2-macroglobulin family)